MDAVRQSLESHLIPNDALVADGYDGFLSALAERMHADMLKLCAGAAPQ